MNISALLAGLFSGIIGSMGMGGGAVLIIYLALFTDTSQLNAQGINLIFFIPIALISVIIYTLKGRIKWKTALFFAAFGLIGSIIGISLSNFLKGNLPSIIFGVFLIFTGIKEIFIKVNNK
ncbi:MAG: sulfite exporter TauE/SafE family protein [Clostridia bacterium]|nr:sulfite exporter TauE/SafE family protein [Clostridia bacterium]